MRTKTPTARSITCAGPSPRPRIRTSRFSCIGPKTRSPAYQLQQAQLLVLGETTASAPLASARQFARDGKIVVLPLASAATTTTLGQVLEIPTLTAPEAVVKDYALLAQIDFRHPLFAAFADPRFSDFAKIHWWKYRRLDAAALPGAQTLAQFDSGDPAIVPGAAGQGRRGGFRQQLAARRQPTRAVVEVRAPAPGAARAKQQPATTEGAVFRRR
ncbi:MAG: hypothetical protein WDN28_07395 [Chthoniobacter sp.]